MLAHFFHNLPHRGEGPAGRNCRNDIGNEYPGIYNRLMGRNIVTTDWPRDREVRQDDLEALKAARDLNKLVADEYRSALSAVSAADGSWDVFAYADDVLAGRSTQQHYPVKKDVVLTAVKALDEQDDAA